MTKISLLFALLLFSFSFSQEVILSKSGRKFEKNGVEYKISDYKTQFQNPIAKNHVKEGRGFKTTGNIFGFAGGLLIGAGLPNVLSKDTYSFSFDPYTNYVTKTKINKPGWILVGVGAGLVAIAIPLTVTGSNKVKKGVKTENQFAPKSQNYYQFDFNGNGVALSYNF